MATRSRSLQDHDATWSPWRDPFFVVWFVALVAFGAFVIAVQLWMVSAALD